MIERLPWNCLFHSSETQSCSAFTLFFVVYFTKWFLLYTLHGAKWVVHYLTTLRQPSFRVEGSSFKPPHFHIYRPHATLQHKAQHHCLFSLLQSRYFIHYLCFILLRSVVNVPWVEQPRPPEWPTWRPRRWLTRSGRPASVCRQCPPNLLSQYQTRTLLCHSWCERRADKDMAVR